MPESIPTPAESIVALLACPVTGTPLRREGSELVSIPDGLRYPIRDGIPILLREAAVLPQGIDSLDGFVRNFSSS